MNKSAKLLESLNKIGGTRNIKESVPDRLKIEVNSDTKLEDISKQLLRFARAHYPGTASSLVVKADKDGLHVVKNGVDRSFAMYDDKTNELVLLDECQSKILGEAYIGNKEKVSEKDIKTLKDLNKSRVGKPVLTIENEEIPNSLVISPYTYLMVLDGVVAIEVFNYFNNSFNRIDFSKEEINFIKKLKL